MSKFLFFSEDAKLIAKLALAFPAEQIEIRQKDRFPGADESHQAVVIDGDYLMPEISLKRLRFFTRRRVPVIYIVTAMPGKLVMHLLKSGVMSVLFKDDSPAEIRSELLQAARRRRYAEEIRGLLENEQRIRQYLDILTSLTSDKTIDTVIRELLQAMKSAFHLTEVSFYLHTEERLKSKMVLGRPENGESWSTTADAPTWLQRLITGRRPQWPGKTQTPGHPFSPDTALFPLFVQERFVGLIAAGFARQRPRPTHSGTESLLLQAFCRQVALAVENARLYWDVIRTREELVAREKKALLGQMIVSLNHEINNPLSIISMEAQLLQKNLPDRAERVDSRLANIESNIERIKLILEKISSLNAEEAEIIPYLEGKEMLNLVS